MPRERSSFRKRVGDDMVQKEALSGRTLGGRPGAGGRARSRARSCPSRRLPSAPYLVRLWIADAQAAGPTVLTALSQPDKGGAACPAVAGCPRPGAPNAAASGAASPLLPGLEPGRKRTVVLTGVA